MRIYPHILIDRVTGHRRVVSVATVPARALLGFEAFVHDLGGTQFTQTFEDLHVWADQPDGTILARFARHDDGYVYVLSIDTVTEVTL